MTPDQIERETLIAAPVERVWDVLTQAEHIGGWFADAGAEIDLRPGGELVMRWEEHGSTRARVEVVERPTRLAYRWLAHHADAAAAPAPGNSTRVEFTLAPEGDGTRLRVVETGFAALAASDEQRQGNYDDNVGGWRTVLGRFTDYAQRVAA